MTQEWKKANGEWMLKTVFATSPEEDKKPS